MSSIVGDKPPSSSLSSIDTCLRLLNEYSDQTMKSVEALTTTVAHRRLTESRSNVTGPQQAIAAARAKLSAEQHSSQSAHSSVASVSLDTELQKIVEEVIMLGKQEKELCMLEQRQTQSRAACLEALNHLMNAHEILVNAIQKAKSISKSPTVFGSDDVCRVNVDTVVAFSRRLGSFSAAPIDWEPRDGVPIPNPPAPNSMMIRATRLYDPLIAEWNEHVPTFGDIAPKVIHTSQYPQSMDVDDEWE